MTRRELVASAALAAVAASDGRAHAISPERLPNGIVLPAQWPPHLPGVSRVPMSPPYLALAPAVIPIDVGRQLFVDDFLVERTTMHRTFHAAVYHSSGPVIVPDRPWEREGGKPTAMPFSDGVWYDPLDRRYKAWYMGGYCTSTCYATSADRLHWEKPALDVRPGTNVVLPGLRDSNVVWLDHAERDPARRAASS